MTKLFIDYCHTPKKGVTIIATIIADCFSNLTVVVLSLRVKVLKTKIQKNMQTVSSKSLTDKWLIFGPGKCLHSFWNTMNYSLHKAGTSRRLTTMWPNSSDHFL